MPSLTDVRFAELAQDIACDVHSKTQDDDNILKAQEISRTFVCEWLTPLYRRVFLQSIYSGHYDKYSISIVWSTNPR
jgi:hypothetical protein